MLIFEGIFVMLTLILGPSQFISWALSPDVNNLSDAWEVMMMVWTAFFLPDYSGFLND